jgi:hypothetical protein
MLYIPSMIQRIYTCSNILKTKRQQLRYKYEIRHWFFNFRDNIISFIDPERGGFVEILPLINDDISLGAKPLGKYHHFG